MNDLHPPYRTTSQVLAPTPPRQGASRPTAPPSPRRELEALLQRYQLTHTGVYLSKPPANLALAGGLNTRLYYSYSLYIACNESIFSILLSEMGIV